MITCYKNARIFTGTGLDAECLAVQNGKFIFAGKEADAIRLYPDASFVDLKGCFVSPGFNDSHMHLLELGNTLTQAQLAPCSGSLSEVLQGVKRFYESNLLEDWILGRGWNHDFFTDTNRYPTRDDLDSVCPDKPCLITRACGHVAVANSRALFMAGIADHAPEVSGGLVGCDQSGRPNGVLEENAISMVSSLIPPPDRAGIKRRILLAMQEVNRRGITSIHSDDFCALEVPFEEILSAYQELKDEGLMTVRVTEQCLLPNSDVLHRFLAKGYRTGWGDEWFRIGPLKLLTDGSLGARTAWLQKPYADAPHTCGTAIYKQEELDELVRTAHCAGMQIAAHAIGDAAAQSVLDAIERAQNELPRENTRHGIVHAQVIRNEQVQRMQKLGMHAYIQPIFLDYDTTIVYPRLGDRAQDAYPAASLVKAGVTFSGGSDCPVEPADVLTGIQCAVTRRPVSRSIEKPYLPHEALSLDMALRAFTSSSAYASFEETNKGMIAPGFLADFTVLKIDPFETSPEFIHRIPIKAVYLAGNQVY